VAVVSDEDCPDKHTGAVYCMQFDDRRLVTGSFDHTIKVYLRFAFLQPICN
jgi:hypothetical protein